MSTWHSRSPHRRRGAVPRPRVPPAAGGPGRAARRPTPARSCSTCPASSARPSPTRPASSAPSGCGSTADPTCGATRCPPRRPSTPSSRSRSSASPEGVVSNWMNDHLAPGGHPRGGPARRVLPARRGQRQAGGLQRRERDHAGALAAQDGAGHDFATGAASSTPTGTVTSSSSGPEIEASAPSYGDRFALSHHLDDRGHGLDTGPVRRWRAVRGRWRPGTPSSTSAARGRSWRSSKARCSPRCRRRLRSTSSGSRPEPWTPEPEAVDGPTAPDAGHHRARRSHRGDRAPSGHDHPADGTADGDVPAVLLRVGELRHLHGQAGGRHGLDARQQRPHRRGGRRAAGCSPARRCRPARLVHVAYGYEEG